MASIMNQSNWKSGEGWPGEGKREGRAEKVKFAS